MFGADRCQPGLQKRLWVLPEVFRCTSLCSAQVLAHSRGYSCPGGCGSGSAAEGRVRERGAQHRVLPRAHARAVGVCSCLTSY